jgi:ABC-type multidrug transport system permease subunit
MILQSVGGNALGLLAGSSFSDPKVAMAVAPLFLLPLMIFAGYYLNSSNMPVYVAWIQWISVNFYQRTPL